MTERKDDVMRREFTYEEKILLMHPPQEPAVETEHCPFCRGPVSMESIHANGGACPTCKTHIPLGSFSY